jgi:hypothetical protein
MLLPTGRLIQNTEGAERSVERLALAQGQLSPRSGRLLGLRAIRSVIVELLMLIYR